MFTPCLRVLCCVILVLSGVGLPFSSYSSLFTLWGALICCPSCPASGACLFTLATSRLVVVWCSGLSVLLGRYGVRVLGVSVMGCPCLVGVGVGCVWVACWCYLFLGWVFCTCGVANASLFLQCVLLRHCVIGVF